MAENKRPYIKKIVKTHGGGHGGSWKVAYADFITSMFALFMVLWIMAQAPEVRKAVASYFMDPRGVPMVQTSHSLLDNIGAGIMDSLTSPVSMTSGQGSGPHFSKPLDEVREEVKKLTKAGQQLEQVIQTMPTMASLSDMVSVVMTMEGLRIELSDQVEGTFFDSGSSQPNELLRAVINELVAMLSPMENTLVIEGHTDARPYAIGEGGYSNWELSADRSNAVRRLMLNDGFPAARIAEVRAFADRQPLPGTDPLDGRNRRIAILVRFTFTNAAPPLTFPLQTEKPEPPAAQPSAETPASPVNLKQELDKAEQTPNAEAEAEAKEP